MSYQAFDQGVKADNINEQRAKRKRREAVLKEAELTGEREEMVKMLRFIRKGERFIAKNPDLFPQTPPLCSDLSLLRP